ncbi:MAG: protein-L-isoaspartate O-methyltransferase [Chromatiaceae bacterium]|nr:protein-L-isoaspartate O-methyltransferase [Chromatiaceae bacterium]
MDNSLDLARFNMIQQQVRPWDVLDERVLEAMAEVPREAFVPDAYRGLAYADIEIPLGETSRMLAPKVVGHLLQALAVRPEERVLEIGAGSGYLSACLSRLGASVLSLELDPVLAERARARLAEQAIEQVEIRCGDGLAGAPDEAPFDAIALTGSLPTEAPLARLQAQLAIGGRLFCILGTAPAMEALLITRVAGDRFERVALFETEVPALLNAPEPETFEF